MSLANSLIMEVVMPFNFFPARYEKSHRDLLSPFWPFSFPEFFDESSLPQEFSSMKGVQIYEKEGNLNVEIPLPGLKTDEIEVSLNKGVLIVKGESKEEEKDEKKKYYRSSEKKYSYTLPLPAQIDESTEPQASYTDGMLSVSLRLAKKGETQKIPVKNLKK